MNKNLKFKVSYSEDFNIVLVKLREKDEEYTDNPFDYKTKIGYTVGVSSFKLSFLHFKFPGLVVWAVEREKKALLGKYFKNRKKKDDLHEACEKWSGDVKDFLGLADK